MLSGRKVRVRMDAMSVKHFACVFVLGVVVVAVAMLIGGVAGPSISVIAQPTSGAGVPISHISATCAIGPGGTALPTPITRCWNHGFIFSSRWTQSFDSRMTLHSNAEVDQDITVEVIWQGLEADTGAYSVIYNGTVSRRAQCASGTCKDIVLLRTSSVEHSAYFVQISVPDSTAAATPWLQTADFAFRYRNPEFSMFELGFKATWMVISVIVCLTFFLRTCFECSFCGPIDVLCLCCRPGKSSPLPFQRQEGMNWMSALLLGLVLFNEPLLWCTYYAPAQIFKLISVGMQLTFVALLAAYWLIEFGLIKSNPQAHENISCTRFYLPKLSAIFLYWVMAFAVYGYVLFRMTEDPTYDWASFTSAPLFLLIWGGILAALYVMYLSWLLCRSCTVVRTFRKGEKYIFVLHIVVLVATCLGIAAGAIYSVDITDAFSFMLFNAIFNTYVYMLAYFYTPSMYDELPSDNALVAIEDDKEVPEAMPEALDDDDIEVDTTKPHTVVHLQSASGLAFAEEVGTPAADAQDGHTTIEAHDVDLEEGMQEARTIDHSDTAVEGAASP